MAAAASVAPLQSTVPSSLQQPEAPEPTWPAGHGELDGRRVSWSARRETKAESERKACAPAAYHSKPGDWLVHTVSLSQTPTTSAAPVPPPPASPLAACARRRPAASAE